MDTLSAIEKRSGCRKYLDRPVEKEMIGQILNAGRLAPSAGNLQDRSFILVRDTETKAEIAKTCGNQRWMQTAPVHIVVLSENKKNKKFFGERGEKIYAVQDTAFAAENMLLAATELGLGCSLVVGFVDDKLTDLLKIEHPAIPHAIITIGYAAENPKPSSKYPLEKFIFFEQYNSRIEDAAMAFGEWGTVREHVVSSAVQETKKGSFNLIEKIKALFRSFKSQKKEEMPIEDHFMEEVKMTEMKHEMKEDIPRVLPKK